MLRLLIDVCEPLISDTQRGASASEKSKIAPFLLCFVPTHSDAPRVMSTLQNLLPVSSVTIIYIYDSLLQFVYLSDECIGFIKRMA